jgi:hypothetical protein
MRAITFTIAAYLLASAMAFAQSPDGADAAAGQDPAAPLADAGQARLPGSGFRLQFVPAGKFAGESPAAPGWPGFYETPFGRAGRQGGLGLRFLESAAAGAGEFADDDMPAGQFARDARFTWLGPPAGPGRSRDQPVGSVAGEWRYQWDSNGQFSLSAQHGRIRYLQDGIRSYDGSLALAGAGWLRSFDAGGRNSVYAGIFGGQERGADSRPEGDRNIGGLQIAARWGTGERTDVFAYASALSGRYDRPGTGLVLQRRDLQYDAGIGLNWRFAANWSMRPQFTFTRNDSNIELYDYNRYDLSVTLRRDFR